MKNTIRYNRHRTERSRPQRGYVRWLGFYGAACAHFLRRGSCAEPVWAEDEAAELLLGGFPSLLAVPAPLFADAAALFPDRSRLAAAGKDEDALLAALRRLEALCGEKFNWDRFLERCSRRNRRARFFAALADKLTALAPRALDTSSPQAALRSLSERTAST